MNAEATSSFHRLKEASCSDGAVSNLITEIRQQQAFTVFVETTIQMNFPLHLGWFVVVEVEAAFLSINPTAQRIPNRYT